MIEENPTVPLSTMPQKVVHKEILQALGSVLVSLAKKQNQYLIDDDDFADIDVIMDEYVLTSSDSTLTSMSITSPDLDSESEWTDISNDDVNRQDLIERIAHLHRNVEALMDEIQVACVLERPAEAVLHAPQLHLLAHDAIHQPHHFQRKVCVLPVIFDDILDSISNNPVFRSRSHNQQLPVSIQLAIFLKHLGHYGNVNGPDDLAEWAGVSVGTVVNCTHRVMVALLDLHNNFICFPERGSSAMQKAWRFTESRSCRSWRNGVFAADGSTFNLFRKPSHFGETFYDRKSRYSLNCQVHINFSRQQCTHLVTAYRDATQPPDHQLRFRLSRKHP